MHIRFYMYIHGLSFLLGTHMQMKLLGIVSPLNDSHPSGCENFYYIYYYLFLLIEQSEVVLNEVLILIYLMANDAYHCKVVRWLYFAYLIWRNEYSNNLSIFKIYLFTCNMLLSILHTSPFSDIWFANIFPIMSCLWRNAFQVQKVLFLVKPLLFIFGLLVLMILYLRNHCLIQS